MSLDPLLQLADAAAPEPAAAPAVAADLHLVVFALAGETYAVPIDRVREILRLGPITRVPGAAAHVRGVTNVRGRIIAVADLGAKLGLVPVAAGPDARILLVELRGRVVGVLVDQVRQVSKLPRAAVVAAPDGDRADAEIVTGVARTGADLILLLDLDRALLGAA
jgi:purine-binding chemotaxis protein CheW